MQDREIILYDKYKAYGFNDESIVFPIVRHFYAISVTIDYNIMNTHNNILSSERKNDKSTPDGDYLEQR